MTGSVEAAKDAEKSAAKTKVVDPTPAAAKAAGAAARVTPLARLARNPLAGVKLDARMVDARMGAVAAVALVVGVTFGLVAAPRERTAPALSRIDAALEGARAETARLNGEVERLTLTLAAVRDVGEAARGETRQLGTTLNDRLTQLEQGLDRRIAASSEKLAAPEQSAAATQVSPEKRAAAAMPAAMSAAMPVAATTPVAATQATPRAEPTQTGALPDPRPEGRADAKPKTDTVENWALREVYDGIAMLEDRRRRLIEVVPGDSVPGLGRVEAIERRGRNWVVVTRQGVIAPQTW